MAAIVVWVACPNAATAGKIARAVVADGLAACAGVIPMRASIYRWKGRIERARETLLMIKTRRSAFDRLRRRVRALHPYEVPEIVATPIVAGDAAYLAWVRSSVPRSRG
jgi:periplasmic divalent cation tolerance protein